MGFWKKITKALGKDYKSLPVENRLGLEEQNPSQTGNRVSSYNVQSWNKETHPEGMGRSKLVQDVNYNNGHLSVTYNDGFTAGYDNINPQDAKDFVTSDSKGRWALKHLWKLPYNEE